ncbi:type III polyketide synthase [Paenibacillus sp. 481]|uniref:type III polyketide synthase n=1 Tax=Paenibacillus sp. 481 TaxID=2835869 RepID=UPI001E5CEDBA|nr:type III polyketide synthase [Paenibacillus sp. 481]UHA75246.1 type III polyketide synthase [Paenibacillus sp. 481]
MGTLAKPAIVRPQFIVDQDKMIEILEQLHPNHPQWSTIKRMIRNTEVYTRHIVRPIEEIIEHAGFEQRNLIYMEEARRLGIAAVEQALTHAELQPNEIDLIIVTSCTGFMMPSLTAYLISHFPFREDTKQLPIAQLGCVAGASAINRAFEYCSAYKEANVLIVSVEFCSLCFQPTDNSISDFVSAALFGDSVSACVMRGTGGTGYRVEADRSFLMKNTEHYIAYNVKDTGFHFVLDKKVMSTIETVAPIMRAFTEDTMNSTVDQLNFFVFHTGGRRILDELVKHLEIDEQHVNWSRQSLAECGNLSSVVVFDVLARMFESKERTDGERGLLAAFGPGFTAEMCIGTWKEG